MTGGNWRQMLEEANARIARAGAERSAGADERARVIAHEAARRGRGGAREIARELGVSDNTISQAIARARTAADPPRTLPADTLERVMAADLADIPPLTDTQWRALAHVIRRLIINETWIEDHTGRLLASEITGDDELGAAGIDTTALAAQCRTWNRTAALAVIDACWRNDTTALPTR